MSQSAQLKVPLVISLYTPERRDADTMIDSVHDYSIFRLLLESSTNFLYLCQKRHPTPTSHATRHAIFGVKAEEVKINTSPHGEHVGSVQPQ